MFANRKTAITLILIAATAAFSTASISTNYGGNQANFVGTYYTGGAMMTFHSDKTVSGVPSDMFSFSPARDNRRQTPALGVWRIVSKRAIEVTTIFFFPEQFGDNYDPNGLIIKLKYLARFEPKVNGVSPGYTTHNVVAEVFTVDQNPTSDQPVSVVQVEGGRGYRLEAK